MADYIKYPIGIQTFSEIIEGGYIYVDKTRLISKLVNFGKYYFLSRPRRFGKSLLLSTLEAFFRGDKRLFEGLAIHDEEQAWNSYPIFHIDFNNDSYLTKEDLENSLNDKLSVWEEIYGSRIEENSFGRRFEGVIRRAYEKTGKQVVILVDEYDKPLLSVIHDPDTQGQMLDILKPFYVNLKKMDAYIRFGMLSGVSRFSKVSIFSDINNLEDISFSEDFANLCGITEEELLRYFHHGIKALAEKEKIAFGEAVERLRRNYDGYHFVENSEGLYNPFSVLNCLKNSKIRDYWFSTGTPTFMVRLMEQQRVRLTSLYQYRIGIEKLTEGTSKNMSAPTLLYQTGYITIHGFDSETGIYTLGFPNLEVERGFLQFLLPAYAGNPSLDPRFEITEFRNECNQGRPDLFMRRLNSFFSDYNYEQIPDRELHFENVLNDVFKLLGMLVECERHTSDGRIDMVVKVPDYIYIFEFKYAKEADQVESMLTKSARQIQEKEYFLPFITDPRTCFCISAVFTPSTRKLTWRIL